MARFPRWLIRLTVVAAALALIAIVALQTPLVRGRLLELARSYAAREFGVALRSPHLDFSLLSRSIELRDVSLTAASRNEPFFAAERVVVVLGRRIWRGDVEIARLSVAGPRVTLVRYADGTLNLPATQQSAGSSTPLQLGVVSLAGLSLSFDDRAAGRTLSAGPVDLSIDTNGSPPQAGSFGPSAFAARAGEVNVSGTVQGRIGFDGRRVQVDELIVQTSQGRVVATGWADAIADRPAVLAHVTAALNLPQTLRAAGVDAQRVTGQVSAVVDVSGELTAPAVAGTISSRDLKYRALGPLEVEGRSTFSASRIDLDSLDVRSADGDLHAQGAIALGETTQGAGPASHVALRWSNLDIDDLARAMGQPLTIPSGSTASGSATVGFDVASLRAAKWSNLQAKAETTLAPVRKVDGVALGLAGRAEVQLDGGTWSLRHSVHSNNAHADLAGTVSGRLQEDADTLRSTLGGRSTLRVDDIAAALPFLVANGVKLPPGAIEGGSLLAVLEPAGTLERARAGIDLTVEDLRSPSLPKPVNATARLDVDASGVRSQRIEAATGAAAARASGRYAWNGQFDANATIEHGDLSELGVQMTSPDRKSVV